MEAIGSNKIEPHISELQVCYLQYGPLMCRIADYLTLELMMLNAQQI